jgi:predicted Rossmann fold flavoprotein
VPAPAAPPPSPPPGLPPGPFDAVVLGAGAAGLWAAAAAGARGRRVLLLEKNRRVGVKILASGGGACNLTTSLPAREAARWFRPRGERFLGPAFRALPPEGLVEAFRTMGVPTHVEEEMEKVWPDSGRARDVVEALVRRAAAAGVVTRTSTPVVDVVRSGGAFVVRTSAGDVTAPRLVLAVGGRSYPRTGTTGDGYAWAKALGHEVTPLAPALVPLVVETPWVRDLAGIAVPVRVRAEDSQGATLLERGRPVLFTHHGLSGPGAMDVSRFFALAAPWRPPRLRLDLVPESSFEDLRRRIDERIAAAPAAALDRALPERIPDRLRRALVAAAGGEAVRRSAEASKALRHDLVRTLKGLELPVAGTLGWDHAEVTAGGVELDEVDPGTMESRIVPGLFVVGEILDLDGPIGGFNFQSAFATAEVAGRSV